MRTTVRALIILAISAAMALPIASAGAATHPSYPLGHAKSCRVGYHKVNRKHWVVVNGRRVKRGYVDCVWIPVVKTKTTTKLTTTPTTVPTTTVTLRAHLDPSYTQDEYNPLEVTWSFDASANLITDGVSQNDPSLPDGVLELFSNGLLADSVDVGGSTTGGQAIVTYAAYGDETVNVVYDSGTDSATTGDETFDIENPNPPPAVPLSTTTVLTVGTEDEYGNVPVTASVTDANGVVTQGTVNYVISYFYVLCGVGPGGPGTGLCNADGPFVSPAITGTPGQTCEINNAGGDVTSDCSGGGTYNVGPINEVVPPSTVTVAVVATYSGTDDDAASSAVAPYPS